MAPEYTRNTARPASEETPEQGHTFRFTVDLRSSSKVVDDPEYHDAPGFEGAPLVFEVREWSLHAALLKAADLPFSVLMASLIEHESAADAENRGGGDLMVAKALCPVCKRTPAVSPGGAIRRHPKGSETPCPGSGRIPETHATPDAPSTPPGSVVVSPPGIYGSSEAMMAPGTEVPYGYVTLSVVAHIPYDGTNGLSAEQEAARLFEDPGHLSATLDACPNDRIRILLKVDG